MWRDKGSVYGSCFVCFLFDLQEAFENLADNLRFKKIEKWGLHEYADSKYARISRIFRMVAKIINRAACFIGSI